MAHPRPSGRIYRCDVFLERSSCAGATRRRIAASASARVDARLVDEPHHRSQPNDCGRVALIDRAKSRSRAKFLPNSSPSIRWTVPVARRSIDRSEGENGRERNRSRIAWFRLPEVGRSRDSRDESTGKGTGGRHREAFSQASSRNC